MVQCKSPNGLLECQCKRALTDWIQRQDLGFRFEEGVQTAVGNCLRPSIIQATFDHHAQPGGFFHLCGVGSGCDEKSVCENRSSVWLVNHKVCVCVYVDNKVVVTRCADNYFNRVPQRESWARLRDPSRVESTATQKGQSEHSTHNTQPPVMMMVPRCMNDDQQWRIQCNGWWECVWLRVGLCGCVWFSVV